MPVALDPLAVTPRHQLPMLFAGQTQKEFFINEAFARLDGLCACHVVGERNDPPAAPQAGEMWIIGQQPVGAWTGFSGHLALWLENGWRTLEPKPGQRVYDLSQTGSRFHVDGDWSLPVTVQPVTGGDVIDVQARAALALIVETLVNSTLLSSPQP